MKQADQDIIQLLREILARTGGGASAVWGAITGTLGNQTDLTNALALKQTAAQVQALIDATPKTVTAQILLASTQVNTNVGTKQVLYTCPANRKALITSVVLRKASASLETMDEALFLGWNAGASDWQNNVAAARLRCLVDDETFLANLTDEQSGSAAYVGEAADEFGCLFGYTAITATIVIDVFGYLLNNSDVPVANA